MRGTWITAAVFGSATNTLLAPVLIGMEVFGVENGLALFCGLPGGISGQWQALHLYGTETVFLVKIP